MSLSSRHYENDFDQFNPVFYDSDSSYINSHNSKEDDVDVQRRSLYVRGLSGLKNIGNTCYMNSILQCLSACDILRSWLLSDDYFTNLENNCQIELAKKKRLEKSLPPDAMVSIRKVDLDTKILESVTYSLSELFKGMWKQNCNVTPKNFKSVIGKIKSLFTGYSQHDSEELLNLVIDRLHEETKTNVKVRFNYLSDKVCDYMEANKYCAKKINDENADPEQREKYLNYLLELKKNNFETAIVSDAYIYWKNYVKNSHSIITDLFTGLFYSRVTCTECKRISPTFESFRSLPIETKQSGNTTLKESLNEFTKDEELVDAFMCEYCNKKVLARKKMYIWATPHILVIHLKRFKNTGSIVSKTSSMVSFPIEDLDVSEYQCDLYKEDKTKYDLFAISEHRGSYQCGHYIAYCKNSINNKWYKFNDEDVFHIPNENLQKELVTENAYILFYVKKGYN